MKTVSILILALLLTTLMSERVIASTTSKTKVVRGELIYVLCASNVHVRSENLKTVLFTTAAYERVQPFQGWGDNKKTLSVRGKNYSFVKIQFADDLNRPTDIGWVAQDYVKLKADCAGAEVPQVSTAHDPLHDITGLNDSRCCLFPIENRPQASYTTGARAFGAGRKNTKTGGYRAHAAVDLYTGLYKNVRAVATGKVLYSPRYFYEKTFEIAIKHAGGFIVRYGEIAPNRHAKGIEKNAAVKTGQVVGYAGQTIDKKGHKVGPQPMLHLELYSGKIASGDLTQDSRGPYLRRADLMNPTKYVEHWEQLTF